VDQAGVNYWVPRLRTSPPHEVLAALLGGEEYYKGNGASPRRLVLALYRDLLGKSDLQKFHIDYWTERIVKYGSREAMIREFLYNSNANVLALGAAPDAPPAVQQPPPVQVQPPVQLQPNPGYVTPRPASPSWSRHRWLERDRDGRYDRQPEDRR